MSRAAGERDDRLHDLRLAGRRLGTATIMFHQAVADRLGLNLTDHKCVDLLLLNGPLTAGELARMTSLTTGAITAALDRLEKAGFVKREDDPEDRRRVVVRVVPQRLNVMSKLFDSFSERLDNVVAGYTPQELALRRGFPDSDMRTPFRSPQRNSDSQRHPSGNGSGGEEVMGASGNKPELPEPPAFETTYPAITRWVKDSATSSSATTGTPARSSGRPTSPAYARRG